MLLKTKPFENIEEKFDIKVITPDGKELDIKNRTDKFKVLKSDNLKPIKFETIVTKNTLWRFNYPHKSRKRRLIKKWAKKQGYTYRKSSVFSITFKGFEDSNIFQYCETFKRT